MAAVTICSDFGALPPPLNWSGLPFPSPGDLPDPRLEGGPETSKEVSRILGRRFTTWATREVKESESEAAQLCPTLYDPMDCSLPGSSVHGIFQARVLEWVSISFSRGSSQSRDQTCVSSIAGRRFINWATRKPSQVLICQFQDWVMKSVTSILLTHTLSFWVLALRK